MHKGNLAVARARRVPSRHPVREQSGSEGARDRGVRLALTTTAANAIRERYRSVCGPSVAPHSVWIPHEQTEETLSACWTTRLRLSPEPVPDRLRGGKAFRRRGRTTRAQWAQRGPTRRGRLRGWFSAAIAVAGDVRDEAVARGLVEGATRMFGGLDIAFNNAGIVGNTYRWVNCGSDTWRETLNVDLTSAYIRRPLSGPSHGGARWSVP